MASINSAAARGALNALGSRLTEGAKHTAAKAVRSKIVNSIRLFLDIGKTNIIIYLPKNQRKIPRPLFAEIR